ncbi:MAG: hypothetical protein MHMPM18_004596, partial [Marteilia pararefringens]
MTRLEQSHLSTRSLLICLALYCQQFIASHPNVSPTDLECCINGEAYSHSGPVDLSLVHKLCKIYVHSRAFIIDYILRILWWSNQENCKRIRAGAQKFEFYKILLQ